MELNKMLKFFLSFFIFLSFFFLNAEDKTHFAICIPSYNNEKYVDWNLQSIFNQDYDEKLFHVYYMNDLSTDNTLEAARNYVKKMNKEHLVTFVDNKEKMYPAGNHYYCAHNLVKNDNAVLVTVDGDDALAHNKVLKYLDRVYSESNPSIYMTYGQFIYKSTQLIGFNHPVDPEISKRHSFRRHFDAFSHLRTCYVWLFKKIRKQDLMYNGSFACMAGDMGIMFPMVEMANGHFAFIPDVLYIYNDVNSISEGKRDPSLQVSIGQYFRSLPSYRPLDPLVAKKITPYVRRKLINVN
jgi:glycosyltransferase involved in cell wall biosynthesis